MSVGLMFVAGVIAGPPGGEANPLRQYTELAYVGSFTVHADRPGARYTDKYQLSSRLFVLQSAKTSTRVAVMTRTVIEGREGGSHRLAAFEVPTSGRPKLPAPPLTGPPPVEAGVFAPSATNVAWKRGKMEYVRGRRCRRYERVSLSGGSKQTDVLWVAPGRRYASRVERIVEAGTAGGPGSTLTLRFDLRRSLPYPGRMGEEIAREVELILDTQARFDALTAQSAPLAPYGRLLAGLDRHTRGRPKSPYRPALDELCDRIRAVLEGR